MALRDKETIEDLRLGEGDWSLGFFFRKGDNLKRKKRKEGKLPIWFWRNYKVVRLRKKVRGFLEESEIFP